MSQHRAPIRVGGFLGLAAASLLVVAAKANVGKEHPPLALADNAKTLAPMPARTIYRTITPTPVIVTETPRAATITGVKSPAVTPLPTQSAHRTLTGIRVETDFGPVQVALEMTGSRIDDVKALAVPDGDPESADISRTSIPELRRQVLRAQSADIHGVSGATYTAQGYALSVQSALDQL